MKHGKNTTEQKKKYNNLPNDYNKGMLDKKSKEYKHTINFHVKNYKFTKVNKLRSLSSKNPNIIPNIIGNFLTA